MRRCERDFTRSVRDRRIAVAAKNYRHAVTICVCASKHRMHLPHAIARAYDKIAATNSKGFDYARKTDIFRNRYPHFPRVRFVYAKRRAATHFPVDYVQHIRNPTKSALFRHHGGFAFMSARIRYATAHDYVFAGFGK